MNKLSTILLSSLFLAQLTACGDDGGDDTGATGTDTSTGTDTTSTGATTSSGTTSSSTTGDDTTTSTSGETEADSSSTTEDADTDTDTAGEPDTDTDTDSAGTDTTDPGDEEIPPMCSYTCEDDEDCFTADVDGNWVDGGFSCVSGQCILACEEDADCDTIFWPACSDECATACVLIGDEERCALALPSEVFACESAMMVEREFENADGETVAVCVMQTMTCEEVNGLNVCTTPIPEPTPCNEEGGECLDGWTCDEDSGRCIQCAEDSECEDGFVCYEGGCLDPCEDPAEDCMLPFNVEAVCE